MLPCPPKLPLNQFSSLLRERQRCESEDAKRKEDCRVRKNRYIAVREEKDRVGVVNSLLLSIISHLSRNGNALALISQLPFFLREK